MMNGDGLILGYGDMEYRQYFTMQLWDSGGGNQVFNIGDDSDSTR